MCSAQALRTPQISSRESVSKMGTWEWRQPGAQSHSANQSVEDSILAQHSAQAHNAAGASLYSVGAARHRIDGTLRTRNPGSDERNTTLGRKC